MRLQISKSKNAESFYVIRSVNEKGKRTNIVYEKLGTLKQVTEKANGKDPYQWAKEYVQELTKKEKEQQEESVVLELSTRSNTAESNRAYYEAGHVFLQKMFYRLGWNKLSGKLKEGTTLTIALEGRLDTVTAEDLDKELKESLDGIKELMIETCLSKLPEIRVGKQEKPKG